MPARPDDLKLIANNWDALLAAAEEGFEEHGRGTILADTTRIVNGGHPIQYVKLATLPNDDEDGRRLVREYDPQKEVVVSLVAADDGLVHSYRLGRPTAKSLIRRGIRE